MLVFARRLRFLRVPLQTQSDANGSAEELLVRVAWGHGKDSITTVQSVNLLSSLPEGTGNPDFFTLALTTPVFIWFIPGLRSARYTCAVRPTPLWANSLPYQMTGVGTRLPPRFQLLQPVP